MQNRRSFLKITAIAGGGLLVNIKYLPLFGQVINNTNPIDPGSWIEMNGFIKIMADNTIKILNPNPDFGQNVMTSLPMIVAEELDADWKNVLVEMAPRDSKLGAQFTGGSNSVRTYWKPLRQAGATVRQMLKEAAAQNWNVPVSEITTKASILYHKKSGKSATYGSIASQAAKLPVPTNVQLKNVNDFTIVGHSQKNVEGLKIVTGEPLFGIDYTQEGMLIAMVIHPPAFGKALDSFEANEALKMPGIKNIFSFKLVEDPQKGSDSSSFNELIAVVGNSTWEVMNARKKINAKWKTAPNKNGDVFLESTTTQLEKMKEYALKPAQVLRKDGDPEATFKNAAQVIERTYTAPFLAHNCMEPMNFFADVRDDKVLLIGATQAPGSIQSAIAKTLNMPADKVEIRMSRMGGGFGRRFYGHYSTEAALISKKMKAPIKLIYTREDDMTYGIYRPMYTATYRAAFDKDKNLIAFHVKGGGIPEHPVHANRFPAGAVDNYLAEGWQIPSNITIGAFRAPRSNFNAAAEQSFLDELAEVSGKDPIEFRIELLKKAKESPVGKNNDYNAERYIGVLELLKEKSGWGKPENKKYSRGVAAYFCHNSYAAHVVDMVMKDGQPYVERVFSTVDCGIVINPDAAANMVQGAVVDGIGNAFYGGLTFKDGVPQQSNFNQYRMIRMNEAPKKIDVSFIDNDIDPTGLGEPPFPPVFGAVANALYQLKGKRNYNQPYELNLLPLKGF